MAKVREDYRNHKKNRPDWLRHPRVETSGGDELVDEDKGDIVVSGGGTIWTLDPTVVTAFARTFLDDPDAGTVRTTLGLGTAATQNTGTSGATLPFLNGINAWSAKQTFNSNIGFIASGQIHFTTALNFYSGNGTTLEISFQDTGLRIWGMTTTANPANVHYDNALTELLLRSTSSEKYKKNIEPVQLKYSYKLVNELDPIWYRSNTDLCVHDNPAWSFWGFSAEQAASIDPRMVSYDKEGKPTSFNYERLCVHHHAVIRDLLARIEKLEKGLNAKANIA